MELGINGKLALVTGGSRGIGRAIAFSLAREGARVAVISRSLRDLNSLMAEMPGRNKEHLVIALDLEKEKAPQKLFQKLKKGFGIPEIIVHNLGGTLDIKDPFCSIQEWRKVYRVNFEVAVEINSLITPYLRKKKWGRIIHISSISAMENHGPVTYCAAKAALTAYTRSFGGVVAPDGVVVSAVLPGAVFTKNGYWDIISKRNPRHVKKFLTERQRIGRFGRPEEIANFVVFLCSQLASFNTGSIIPVDGGQGRGYFGQ